MLAILTLARVIMLFQFALSPFSEISFKEQLGFFILSLRFDLKIITMRILDLYYSQFAYFPLIFSKKLKNSYKFTVIL